MHPGVNFPSFCHFRGLTEVGVNLFPLHFRCPPPQKTKTNERKKEEETNTQQATNTSYTSPKNVMVCPLFDPLPKEHTTIKIIMWIFLFQKAHERRNRSLLSHLFCRQSHPRSERGVSYFSKPMQDEVETCNFILYRRYTQCRSHYGFSSFSKLTKDEYKRAISSSIASTYILQQPRSQCVFSYFSKHRIDEIETGYLIFYRKHAQQQRSQCFPPILANPCKTK